jgi:hypothetical protein
VSLLSLLTQTATVVRVPFDASNPRGVPTEGTVSRIDYPARLENTDATEVLGEWDTVVSNWRLYLPGEVAIRAKDQVVVDGVTYEVVSAAVISTPRGPHHTVARLRNRQPVREGRGAFPVLPG